MLLQLKHHKPTSKWIKRLVDGFDSICVGAIVDSEVIFDNYIYGLLKVKNLSKGQITECIDQAISDFNKIGGYVKPKYNDFIETVEREEILAFLEEGAKIAGLSSDIYIDDITNVVREW